MDPNPPPLTVSLHFCDLLIVEAVTKKVSMIGGFEALIASEFPAVFSPFRIWTYLSDYLGECIIHLEIHSLDNDEVVYSDTQSWHFIDKLRAQPVFFTIRDCIFPRAGAYECELTVAGKTLSTRRFEVH